MAEKAKAKGTESPDAEGGGNQPGGERTFTQAELDALIRDRLARERNKYANYDALVAKAEKLDAIEEAQKSELQKAQEAVEKAEREREAGLARANERLIRAEFIAAASRLQVKHPADAFALADRSAIAVTEDGKVAGVKEAVEALVENGRLPLMGKPKAPDLEGGAGSGKRASDSKPPTEAEKATAKKMNLTIEQYMAGKKKERS
jgi:hypothetical protein